MTICTSYTLINVRGIYIILEESLECCYQHYIAGLPRQPSIEAAAAKAHTWPGGGNSQGPSRPQNIVRMANCI